MYSYFIRLIKEKHFKGLLGLQEKAALPPFNEYFPLESLEQVSHLILAEYLMA